MKEIDRIMPQYDFEETHERLIHCTPEEAFDSLRELDFKDSPLIRTLFFLRGLKSHRFDELSHFFTPLYIKAGEEWVFGLVGKPWTLTGHILHLTPEAFTSFNTPGYAKMIWNFSFEKVDDKTRVVTETRILCLDEASRKRFKYYWMFVKPFSGLVRIKMLKMMEKKVAHNYRSS